MRRRFDKFRDKVLDRPRLPGLANSKPISLTQPNPVTDSLNLLTARCYNVQHEELKQSISALVEFVGGIGWVGDDTIFNKLDIEIKRLSELVLLIEKKDGLSVIYEQLGVLASEIANATINADTLINKSSTELPVAESSNTLLGLADELHIAVDGFQAKVPALDVSLITAPQITKTGRKVSGRVVGALTIAKEALDCVPIPGVKAAVGGLLEVLKAIDKAIDNEDDLVSLISHLQRLVKIVTPLTDAEVDLVDAPLHSRIDDLTSDMQQITIEASKLEKQNTGNKFLGSADNASCIAALSKAVDQAVDRFQVAGGISAERSLGRLHQGVGGLRENVGRIDGGVRRLEDGSDRIEKGMGMVEDGVGAIGKSVGRLEDMLLRMGSSRLSADEEISLNIIHPRADNARYDSPSQTSSSFCLENTRVSILNKVEQWAADPTAPPIFWLCGMAGTGKSTIARTVAKFIDESHSLGATFFFSRDEDNRRTTDMVFTTIAYQLARRNSSFRPSIIKAANPDVCTAMMRTQLERLVVQPLQQCNATSFSPVVIVMDALDECTDESRITEMLILLAPAIGTLRKSINIKLFVTSRPEVHISSEFSEPGMEAVSDVSILHDIEKSLVRADIRHYIEHHLARIAKVMLPKGASWPLPHEIDMLVGLADGLFIFAAVTVAYVGDTKHRQPKQRLRNVLSATAQDQKARSLKHLDILYRQVLMASLPDPDPSDDNQEVVGRILSILGAVVLLMNPLSTRSLEKLLQWEEDTAESVLGPFHSILSVPPDPNPVRVFHKSFPDFLTNKKRSGDLGFHVDPPKHHTELALLCLTHMNSCLERDICGVGDQLVHEIENIDALLRTKVQDHVLYACQHWGNHLKDAEHTPELGKALDGFSKTKLLYWLEIMSLSGKLGMGVSLLKSAEVWSRNQTTKSVLYDCYRFLLNFHKAIALGPGHIYHSALPFIPRCDLFSVWKKELDDSVVVKRGRAEGWNAALFTLAGHAQSVYGVAYSPDSTQLASGANDNTIIIWDCKAGVQIKTLTGHSGLVYRVAFSPDGTQIASGSWDGTVRVWNSRTGAQIHALSEHSSEVDTVVFSPDGSILASGSHDKTIVLWNVGTCSVARVLFGHTSWVFAVIFSPDGTRIVSGSGDKSVGIWDTLTGALLKSLRGHSDPVTTVAFSPDGTRIVSGSSDCTINIWDFNQGVLIRTLMDHTSSVNSIAFSPDGEWMVSGSSDQTIGIWDAKGIQLINRLYGHSLGVSSVGVSPDNTQIVSGSHDHSVIVWDMSSIVISGKPEKHHTYEVLSIAFSPDGNQIASGSVDETIVIWNAKTGDPINTLRGHDIIIQVAYSPDSKYIASGSRDRSVKLWDSQTGALVKSLEGHRLWVKEVSFSLDGLYIISRDYNGFYHRWDRQILGKYSLITVEEAKALLGNSATQGVVAPRSYLERGGKSPWILSKSQAKVPERVCFLSHHGISTHSSLGHTFAYGTKSGMVYILDFSRRLGAM